MTSLCAFAKARNIKVIEDAAQGVGVKYKNQHVGTFGDLGVLSFYGNKTITCGEGGVIVTDDKELRDCCYRLKNHGRDGKGTFKHEHIGYNFLLHRDASSNRYITNEKVTAIIKKKKQIHDLYVKELGSLSKHFVPVAEVKNAHQFGGSPLFFVIRKRVN